MASGKTTIGALLATRLGRPFVDNDVLLQQRTGRSAREIADTEGAEALHAREAEALLAGLANTVPAVIDAAAAAPMEPGAAAALRGHDVVYLRAPPDVLARRLSTQHDDDHHRPFLGNEGPEAQFAARDEPYRELATVTVEVGVDSPEAVAAQISSALAG